MVGARELTPLAFVFATASTEDLAGIKVSHDMDDFDEGEHILTLKDSRILDGEEDELHNVDLAGHEDTEKNLELKRKRQEYSGYDDDEFDPSMLGVKKKVLSKYDVDIDGAASTEELVSRASTHRPLHTACSSSVRTHLSFVFSRRVSDLEVRLRPRRSQRLRLARTTSLWRAT